MTGRRQQLAPLRDAPRMQRCPTDNLTIRRTPTRTIHPAATPAISRIVRPQTSKTLKPAGNSDMLYPLSIWHANVPAHARIDLNHRNGLPATEGLVA
jgi:hypothetical protein